MTVMKYLERLVNKIEKHLWADKYLSLIASIADRHKVQLYVIGGHIRDILLGLDTKDTDFAVLKGKAAFYNDLEKHLKHHVITFRKKGIVNRRIMVGDRVFDFVDASKKGLDYEISRRDFTINSISYYLKGKELLDPQNGIKDLKEKIIRRNKKSVFRSDPLRMIRAIRLSCEKTGFTIDEETFHQIKSSPENIKRISKERVKEELDKILITPHSSKGISLLYETGILRILIPEIIPLEGFAQGSRHRYDAWQHTLKTLSFADNHAMLCKQLRIGSKLNEESILVLKYSLLFHDIAKPQTFSTDESGNVHFYHHERVSSMVASRIMKRLKFSNHFIHDVKALIELHLRPHLLAETKPTQKALIRLVRESNGLIEPMVLHALADAKATEAKASSPKITRLKNLLERLLETYDDQKARMTAPAKLISGDDVMHLLGWSQGPQVGRILKKVEDLHLTGEITSREEAIKYIKKLA